MLSTRHGNSYDVRDSKNRTLVVAIRNDATELDAAILERPSRFDIWYTLSPARPASPRKIIPTLIAEQSQI